MEVVMMCNHGKTRLLWLSTAAGIFYLICMSHYIAGSGGRIWPGVSVSLIVPHILCTVSAVVFTVAGILSRQNRALLYGAILYGAAAACFPPFHMFLIAPTALMAAWYLKRLPKAA